MERAPAIRSLSMESNGSGSADTAAWTAVDGPSRSCIPGCSRTSTTTPSKSRTSCQRMCGTKATPEGFRGRKRAPSDGGKGNFGQSFPCWRRSWNCSRNHCSGQGAFWLELGICSACIGRSPLWRGFRREVRVLGARSTSPWPTHFALGVHGTGSKLAFTSDTREMKVRERRTD